ncbi:MAG TPA: hypothetical protein H9902_14320 [Candidatus Stackebrandtia faecavium]|nr:hypothetical protein [Candidatus Stackebrandtia faecavium]
MASDPEFDEFANFVASHHSTLRQDAARLVGPDSLTHVLMLRVLTELAKNWRFASRSDPEEFLSKQLDTHSRGFWREDSGNHEAPDIAEQNPNQLAAAAWAAGVRARKRRTGGRILMVSVVVVLLVAYGLSVALDNDGPAERTHHAETATPVTDMVAVLPPPDVTKKSPQYAEAFSEAAKPTVGTPSLQEDPVVAMAAIVYGSSQSPVVIGKDGRQRRFDTGAAEDTATLVHPRSISPDGTRAALTPNDDLAILSADGGLETVELQEDIGIIFDLAWIGENLQVTTSTGSYTVGIGSGSVKSAKWYGPDTTQVAGQDGAVAEFVTTETSPLVLRTWEGDEETANTSGQLPVKQWRSVPLNDRSQFARGCVVADTLEVPASYGSPQACIAVVDSDASLENMIVLTDKYGGDSRLLGFADGKVFFTVNHKSTEPTMVMVWQPDSNRLQKAFPLVKGQSLALGEI